MGTARESSGFWSHEAIPTAHLIQLRIQVAYPTAVVRAIVTLPAPVTATRAACHFAAWMGPLYVSGQRKVKYGNYKETWANLEET